MKTKLLFYLLLSLFFSASLLAQKGIDNLSINLYDVPFSYFGSYMSLSTRNAHNTLRLSDHANGNKTIATFFTLYNNENVTLEYDATPVIVRGKNDKGIVESVFQSSNVLRMRTVGLDLKLLINVKSHNFIKVPGYKNTYKIRLHNYIISVIEGEIELSIIDENTMSLIIKAKNGDKTELAIEQFNADWSPKNFNSSFNECLTNSKATITDWDRNFKPAPNEYEETRQLASYLLWSSAYNPRGFVKRFGIAMSKNWMNNIWSWDNCFNAIALSYAHPTLALDQLHVILDHQDSTGCLPDYVNSGSMSWNSKKPPIYGWTVLKMMENMELPLSEKQLLYDKIVKLTNYWLLNRDEDKNGIPHYYHGNDSGWDNSTNFLVGVPLESPDLLAFLSVQAKLLSILADDLKKSEESVYWKMESTKIKDRLIANLWNGSRFFARNANDNTKIDNGSSLMQFLPIILGKEMPNSISKIMVDHLTLPNGFYTEHGLATENTSSNYYVADGYWKGPIWAPSTAIIVDGLKRARKTDLANDIALRFVRLCNKGGFAENFDAISGKPLRDPAYTWTASVYIMFLNEYLKSKN